MVRRNLWRRAGAIAVTLGVVAGCGLVTPTLRGTDPTELTKARAQVAGAGMATVVVTYGTAKNLSALADAGFDVWGVDGKRAKGVANAATLNAIAKLNLPDRKSVV